MMKSASWSPPTRPWVGRATPSRRGGLGLPPPRAPEDVHAIARELDSSKTTIEQHQSLDASPRRLCALIGVRR